MRMVNCSASGNFFRRSKTRGVWGGWRWPIESDWERWWWDLGAFELGRMYLENHWGDLGWVKFDFKFSLLGPSLKLAYVFQMLLDELKPYKGSITHISVHYCPISISIHLHPSTSTKQPRCSCRRTVPSDRHVSDLPRGQDGEIKPPALVFVQSKVSWPWGSMGVNGDPAEIVISHHKYS